VRSPVLFGTKRSQVQILSPRLFSETSLSARTSKGFLIVGTRVAARRSCSNRAASWSNVPDQLTQPLLALHDRRFKSCRQIQRQLTDPLHGRPTRIREILDRTGLGRTPTAGQANASGMRGSPCLTKPLGTWARHKPAADRPRVFLGEAVMERCHRRPVTWPSAAP
jgi:hypothetical protein